MKLAPWPFWQFTSAEANEGLDGVAHRDVTPYLRVLNAMMTERPPLRREPVAWRRITGHSRDRDWTRFLGRLVAAGKLKSSDGGVTSSRAEVEWEKRDAISEQNSLNASGPRKRIASRTRTKAALSTAGAFAP